MGGVRALRSLNYSDTVGWMAGMASASVKTFATYTKGFLLEQAAKENGGRIGKPMFNCITAIKREMLDTVSKANSSLNTRTEWLLSNSMRLQYRK